MKDDNRYNNTFVFIRIKKSSRCKNLKKRLIILFVKAISRCFIVARRMHECSTSKRTNQEKGLKIIKLSNDYLPGLKQSARR